jgi:hypothetical protein
MIGYMAVEAETTKPAICQIEMDFLAQASLGADAKAITDDQHPDHQLGVDRWATHCAVKGGQPPPQLAKLDEPVDGPQHMVSGNVPFKRKLIKQSSLLHSPTSHHDSKSRLSQRLNQRISRVATADFFNRIGHERHFRYAAATSGVHPTADIPLRHTK